MNNVDGSEVLVEEAVVFDASSEVGDAHILAASSLQLRSARPASSIGSAQKRSSTSCTVWVTLGTLPGSMDEITINQSINQSAN